jgi:hypothetical protein
MWGAPLAVAAAAHDGRQVALGDAPGGFSSLTGHRPLPWPRSGAQAAVRRCRHGRGPGLASGRGHGALERPGGLFSPGWGQPGRSVPPCPGLLVGRVGPARAPASDRPSGGGPLWAGPSPGHGPIRWVPCGPGTRQWPIGDDGPGPVYRAVATDSRSSPPGRPKTREGPGPSGPRLLQAPRPSARGSPGD